MPPHAAGSRCSRCAARPPGGPSSRRSPWPCFHPTTHAGCGRAPRPPRGPGVGWGHGKFVSWVAATRAQPGEAVIVQPGEEGSFLAAQPLAALPLDSDTHRRLRQLGVTTLGALAALPEEAVVSQFGRVGRRLWRLAAGGDAQPGGGRGVRPPVLAPDPLFSPRRAARGPPPPPPPPPARR